MDDLKSLAPDQRLAVATAIKKASDKALDAREPGSIRQVADSYIKGKLPDGGNVHVRLNGRKIGTYSVVAKEVDDGIDVYMSDAEAFGDWVRDEDAAGNAAIEWVLADNRRRDAFARHLVELTGVIPEGVEAYPQVPHVELSTRLTHVNVDEVAKAIGDELPQAVAGLLGGE